MKKRWIKDGKFLTCNYVDIGEWRIFNPSDLLIVEAGYSLYVLPEPSDLEKLEKERSKKLNQAIEYYKSPSVSEFSVNGNKMWVGHSARTCFKRTLDEFRDMNRKEMSYTYNGVSYTFDMDVWFEIFFAVDIYGNLASNVLENHKIEILALLTIEEIENYDFTTGYPEKLVFDYTAEPTPEQLLAHAKVNKLSALDSYDLSDAVNSFTLGGLQMWLTRDERTQIDESVHAYEAAGAIEMTKYFNGVPYTFTLTQWKQMLNALIVYASEALNVTEAHKVAINALETVEEVEEYDFTAGYPSKLEF